jgi:hypothetical protein
MAALSFSDGLTELDTILADSSNTTFSTAEKSRALTKAWNDPYVINIVWDTSLTYTQGTYQKTLPATLTTLKDIYLSPTGSTQPMPEPISNDLWEVVNGIIQFNQRTDNTIPNGYTLYLKGNYKLTVNDPITPVNLQEYVMSLAGANTLTLLAHKKANLFVKNDVTMGELIGLRRELMSDVKERRARLIKEYESA